MLEKLWRQCRCRSVISDRGHLESCAWIGHARNWTSRSPSHHWLWRAVPSWNQEHSKSIPV